jgi:O-antigen ligase
MLTFLDRLTIARYTLILILISILFSPPITTVLEFFLYALILFSKELQTKIKESISQPLAITSILFYTVIIASSINPLVTWSESLSSVWSWRKILLLPIALSIFDDNQWKNKACIAFIIVASICTILSFISSITEFPIYKYPAGIIIRNHATQGIIFSIAAFTSAIYLLFNTEKTQKSRENLIILTTILLTANVIYTTPGRSGYLALIVSSISFITIYIHKTKKYRLPLLLGILIPVLLLTSSNVQQRVNQGLEEATTYNTNKQATSMGIRMVLWRNTIDLIKEHPFIGYGTGGFEKAYQAKIKNEPEWKHDITHDPHNQFLKITTEQGMAGIISFITLIFSSCFQKPKYIFFTLGITVLLTWCLNSLFSSHFSTFSEGRFIFLWLGIMMSNQKHKKTLG